MNSQGSYIKLITIGNAFHELSSHSFYLINSLRKCKKLFGFGERTFELKVPNLNR
ncbi:pEARLI 4 [Chlamydia pneumoniae TW-183]|uniref:PEARLI 4 n=1 Tax=Chlamydia pneumoniae TaxID=83558 RepID=A0ABN3YPN6_CHLPN|nr:pEARLI 4 [Chlamydia pneumoniae TW-183]